MTNHCFIVLGNDIKEIQSDFVKETGLEIVPLKSLLKQADFITIHCDLSPTSHSLINEKAFDLKKRMVEIVSLLGMSYLDVERVECFRSFGSSSKRTIARCHALGKLIWDLFSTLPPPPRPRDDLHGLPDSLAPVYFRATAYDMEGRYGSIQELRTDFEEAVTHITSNNG